MTLDYDITKAFSVIEDDIIDKLFKEIQANTLNDDLDSKDINEWRLRQLQALQRFKADNRDKFKNQDVNEIYNKVKKALKYNYNTGYSNTKKTIREEVKKNMNLAENSNKVKDTDKLATLNDRKLNALISETTGNLYGAQYSALRYSEGSYRKIIFDTNTYFNIDGITLAQAIDKATKDFLSAGINNIEYSDGRRVNIQSYAEMAMRTASKRSYMQGEAKMRDEFGTNLVIVTRRGEACPKCMQFVGRVFVDDVYSCIDVKPSKYERLSNAISGGLYHPNCRDVHTTYFEGDTTLRQPPTLEEVEEAKRVYKLEQKQRYYERKVRKYDRLEKYSFDEDNKVENRDKKRFWQDKLKNLVDSDGKLKRRYYREKNYGLDDDTVKPTDNTKNNKKANVKSIKELDIVNSEVKKEVYKIDAIKFVSVENSYNTINKSIRPALDDQIADLENKFHVIDNSKITLMANRSEQYMACVRRTIVNPINGKLIISKAYHTDKDKLIETMKRNVIDKWMMPCNDDDETLLTYPITHEYGHMIQNSLIQKEIDKVGYDNLIEKCNLKAKSSDDKLFPFIQLSYDFADNCRKELINIATKKNKDFDILKNLSEYAKSNSYEFFAECFANSQLGKPNELGQAMIEFLEKRGLK